jgi:O-antigen/teichoic acid export membrane protein
MTIFRGFLKQSAIYSIGTAIARLSSLLLLPLYTRFLLPSDYGSLDILIAITVFLQAFFTLGIDTSIQILFFDPSFPTKKDKNDLVMTSIILVSCTASAWTLIGVLLSPILVNTLLTDNQFVLILQLLFIDRGIMSLLVLARAVLRIRQQPLLFNFTIISQIVLVGGLNILFVAVQKWGILGVSLGNLIADLVVTLFAGILAFRPHLQMPNLSQALPLMRLGLPLLPITAAYWVLNLSDRFFLSKLSTINEVGLYGIAARLASGMVIITSAIQYGWRPFALSLQTNEKSRFLYASMPIYYFITVGFAGLVIVAASPVILKIFATETYSAAIIFLPPLIFSGMMFGGYYILSTGLEIVKCNYHLSWIIALAGIINIIFNCLLIPPLGALGASIATAIAYSFSTLLVGIVSHRLYPLPYEISRITGVCVVLIVAYGIVTIIFSLEISYHWIFSVIYVLLVGIILSSFAKSEIKWLTNKVYCKIKKNNLF